MGQGHLTDLYNNNVMMLGTIRLNVTSLSTNNYIGFIYSLVVDLGVNFGTDVKTSCNGLCSVCLSDGTCLSTCAIGQYPSGVTSNPCLNCASTCTSIGCRDTDTTCNLCLDKNCKICPDFTTKIALYTFALETHLNYQHHQTVKIVIVPAQVVITLVQPLVYHAIMAFF